PGPPPSASGPPISPARSRRFTRRWRSRPGGRAVRGRWSCAVALAFALSSCPAAAFTVFSGIGVDDLRAVTDLCNGCWKAPVGSVRAAMMMVIGGAGFIGANIVASLNEAVRTDVVVNDLLGADSKWRNLAKRQIADFVPPADLARWLEGRKLEAVIHMGAISS